MSGIRVGPLVRATSSTIATFWLECIQAGTITIHAVPEQPSAQAEREVTVHTTQIGTRFFAAPQLHELHPGSWYHYSIQFQPDLQVEKEIISDPSYHFRTFNDALEPHELRILYGSCRKPQQPESDMLNRLNDWLTQHQEQREASWPHLLLLIGDQIYADEPVPELLEQYPQLHNGARTFEDFAMMYEYGWTNCPGVREVLASLPSFMLFDDHEITNNWNEHPRWCNEMLAQGQGTLLIDGLVAYWVYQGWGNLLERDEQKQPLLRVMREATERQEDALPRLRSYIEAEIHDEIHLPWHFIIPTTPAIFVTNTRTERSNVRSGDASKIYAPGTILNQEQMNDLRQWLGQQQQGTAILASSVPILLPPVIGLGEYIMGSRLWYQSIPPLRSLGLLLARIQSRIARKSSFDHWPLYNASWHTFIKLINEYNGNVFALSGDVHFSYAMEAQSTGYKKNMRLYQLVCTPIQNSLGDADQRKIKMQSRITSSRYGGLRTKVLSLFACHPEIKTYNDLLFDNTLALVTVNPQGKGYSVQQQYLGLAHGKVSVIAQTEFAN